MAATVSLLSTLRGHGPRTALCDAHRSVSYDELLRAAGRLASRLTADRGDLRGERVLLLVAPSIDYVVGLLAIWLARGVAVPLKPGLPAPEIDYVLSDAAPALVVIGPDLVAEVAGPAARRGVEVLELDGGGDSDDGPAAALPEGALGDPALMLYTSGTTGPPKGVVHTHGSLAAQVSSLVEAWRWTGEDRILLVLPLHHVHGIVNVVCCALWSGAVCEMAPAFDAEAVWERFAEGDLTLFMAVPTIYRRLLDTWDRADPDTRTRWSDGARRLRLMVSGSAALPVGTLERWREVTGHVLLERYGMTEIGMALSNTLDSRVPGSVGYPLPGVEVRLVDDDGRPVEEDGRPGELLVRGPTLFTEYWRQPETTAAAFDGDWFRTGDVATRQDGRYRLLGRSSVDILKSGGEKVSALEVEDVLRTHEAIVDCAVVGLPDPDWGQVICAAVVSDGTPLEGDALRAWGKARLADFKVPRVFLTVPELPRNALGKVVKPRVAELFAER